jgi:hypothetical protein
MIGPIKIVDSGIEFEIYTGIFSVYVLDGWDVAVENFSFSLTNTKTGKVIYPKDTLLRVQSNELGRLAKKIKILDIPERGNYRIDFKNINDLKIWKSKFPLIFRSFIKPIEKQNIEICIV